MNELHRYETDQRLENNHLFIKSKNYYESPKHQKYKSDEVYYNRNVNPSNVEDWRARPRDEEVIYENSNAPSRLSPLKNAQQKDSRFRDDGKKEKRKFSREIKGPLNSDVPVLQGGSENPCVPVEAVPLNKTRNRRKKPEEGPIPWILPNQTGEVFTDT